MTVSFTPGGAVNRPARLPVERKPEDRWLSVRAASRPSGLLLAILAASFGAHAIVMATLAIANNAPIPPKPQEIAVEVVQDVPKPPEPKPPEAKAPPPPKVEAAKVEPPKPPPPPPPAAKPEPPSQIDELQKELASLKAEQAALKAEAQAKGSGPMAQSQQAAALPSVGDAADADAVDYQSIVFSQLAKAKGDDRHKGQKGTAGVRFEIDAAGALVDVDVVTPSGIASLDAEALDIVRRAAPFPAPPKDAQRQFFANVNFVPQGEP